MEGEMEVFQDENGQMVYQDEDGNMVMYNQEDMMEDDGMGDDDEYGMEGSPDEVRIKVLTLL